MTNELDTDEVYLYDGGDADAEIWRYHVGSPFGPFMSVEVSDGNALASVELHSPDTAARWALAILARMDGEDTDPAYKTAIRALTFLINKEEEKHDFKIGEEVEVFDPNKDVDWIRATVIEYNRHGGYRVRNYWEGLDWYAPNHVRKVSEDAG